MKWTELWARISPPRITIYADFIDPFCYIGFHNAARAAESKGISLDWRGFELNPDTPLEGSALETAANSDLRAGMWASVQAYAKKSGLLLTEPERVSNTRLAHLWVYSVPDPHVKKRLIERIYQAYLSDKKDIGNRETLSALAAEFHLPQERLRRLAESGDSSPLEASRRKAMDRRFPGMPGFVWRGKIYFGALSEDAWRKMITEETVCSTR